MVKSGRDDSGNHSSVYDDDRHQHRRYGGTTGVFRAPATRLSPRLT